MKLQKIIVFSLIFSVLLCLSFGSIVSAQEKEGSLINELVTRHPSYTRESLVSLMGSEDELVFNLLNLRHSSKPPVLGTRCEKLLIGFSDREDVQLALLEDVKSDAFFGLTSIILSSLKEIQDKDFRRELVNEAIGNSKASSTNVKRYKAIINELPSNVLN